MVLVIYHNAERIWRILVTPITKKYHPGEPVNIHTKSLINIMQEKNRVITTKRVMANYHYFVVMENG